MKLNSIVGAFLLCLACSLSAGSADALKEGFMNPPDSAKPHTWWHWVNGNVSQEGITKDLEAMKAVGIGGFVLFDGSVLIPAGPVGFNLSAPAKSPRSNSAGLPLRAICSIFPFPTRSRVRGRSL